jgi:hypothetical protein
MTMEIPVNPPRNTGDFFCLLTGLNIPIQSCPSRIWQSGEWKRVRTPDVLGWGVDDEVRFPFGGNSLFQSA